MSDTTINVRGRGKLHAAASADRDGVNIRICCNRDDAFWAEMYLTLAQLRELCDDCDFVAQEEDDETAKLIGIADDEAAREQVESPVPEGEWPSEAEKASYHAEQARYIASGGDH